MVYMEYREGIDMKNKKGFMKTRYITPSTIDWYLEAIVDMGLECERIEIYSTAGDIRPPYPYQYRAVAKIRAGDDDPFEGIGGTPRAAVRDLWKAIKRALKEWEEI